MPATPVRSRLPKRRLAAALRIGARRCPARSASTRAPSRARRDSPMRTAGAPSPVALQLLADHHRVGGPDALTELGLRDADRDGVVRRDHDPRVDLGRRRLLVPGGAVRGVVLRAPRAAAPRSRARTRPARRRRSREIRDGLTLDRSSSTFPVALHRRRPDGSPAARGDSVPQRQAFVTCASMSASEGSGRSRSSASALMIMPDWQ